MTNYSLLKLKVFSDFWKEVKALILIHLLNSREKSMMLECKQTRILNF